MLCAPCKTPYNCLAEREMRSVHCLRNAPLSEVLWSCGAYPAFYMEPFMKRDPLSTLTWAALAEITLLMLSHLLCSTATLLAAANLSIHDAAEFFLFLPETPRANLYHKCCLRFAELAHLRTGSDKMDDIAAPAGHQMLSWTI